jgi:hypothetical protein
VAVSTTGDVVHIWLSAGLAGRRDGDSRSMIPVPRLTVSEQTISALARSLDEAAVQLRQARGRVRDRGLICQWQSPAATEFAARLQGALGGFGVTAGRLEETASALRRHEGTASSRAIAAARLTATSDALLRPAHLIDLL